jgi:hypothetical protein
MAGEYEDEVNDLGKLDLPYGKEVKVEEIVYEGGMKLLRLRLREGKRHTVIELDPDSAGKWADILGPWAKANAPS